MNKVIAVIIIILLLLGGYFLFRDRSPKQPINNNSTAAPLSTSTNSAGTTTVANSFTVSYTDQGFSPKTINVKRGGSVTFINRSSGQMWVASDPHPTHTDYPGFDEKTSVGNGGSWSFTFQNAGSWGFHNHRNPSSKGTIVVQ